MTRRNNAARKTEPVNDGSRSRAGETSDSELPVSDNDGAATPDLATPAQSARPPATAIGAAAAGATPVIAQYIEIKAANPDCLLFYHMGDFYELFFEDAVIAAEALDIQLTSRGKYQGEPIPMCGVPLRRADDYLQKLVRKGFRVAVCEQLEDPAQAKKRGSKAVVRRDVTRLVTAGTLTEEGLLSPRRNNYLASLARVKADQSAPYALAWLDISTGEFSTCTLPAAELLSELARLEPGELLVPETVDLDALFHGGVENGPAAITPLPAPGFDSMAGERALKNYFKVAALDGFGQFTRAEFAAAGALISYVELTQKGNMPAIAPPRRREPDHAMSIDAATRANLELVRTLKGERAGSLIATIDRTITAAGARTLASWLNDPSCRIDLITARLDAVEHFAGDHTARDCLRAKLRQTPDIARALARLSVARGTPRDLGALRDGLEAACGIAEQMRSPRSDQPTLIASALDDLSKAGFSLTRGLADMLAADLPAQISDGGLVREGYDEKLDEARRLRDQSRKVIAGLQAGYADETGIKTLKIRHNNVLGYFIEVTAQHAGRLMDEPHSQRFIHRQTLASAVRFTTAELGELASRIVSAAGEALMIEARIFDEFTNAVKDHAAIITQIADGLARLDVLSALAILAIDENYARPRVDQTRAFEIVQGRHPVVEKALRKNGAGRFIANDCNLTGPEQAEGEHAVAARPLWLLTGPNMAGKSTFLRQNALIAILAQMGSFVPASSAHIGVIDKLFSRVGAADDLARGRSTFMVEMVETATILNRATGKSLVILDEIGRGTATYDGLSIAWASIEYLHGVNRCRTLFATHFHELTSLQNTLEGVANATMRVKEHDGEVIFLHEVAPGAADRSYGIQVARLAGLPDAVLARAGEVLTALESQERDNPGGLAADELPLFSATRPSSPAAMSPPSPLETLIRELAPDELTPREALEMLYRLKNLTNG